MDKTRIVQRQKMTKYRLVLVRYVDTLFTEQKIKTYFHIACQTVSADIGGSDSVTPPIIL